jgi:hypothetical protein
VPPAARQLIFSGLSDAASLLSPQFATIGHTLPDCREEVASSDHRLLVRVSAAYMPQRHGELCNPPVAASGSVEVLLRCGTPSEQHDAIQAQVGLSLPAFVVRAADKPPGTSPEQKPSSSRWRLDLRPRRATVVRSSAPQTAT